MNKLIISIITLLIVVSSWFIFDLSRYLPPDLIFSKGIRYESAEIQARIAKTLKEEKIPFRINIEGFIEYRKKNDERVKKIANEINIALSQAQKVKQPPPNVSFTNPETQKMFVELLKKNGISYRVGRLNDKGNNYVIWDLNDDGKVSELLAHVEQKASFNDSLPSISFPTKKHTEYFTDLLKEEEIPYKVIEKTTQKGVETFIEYGWKDYAKVKRLIRKTVAETQY